MKKTFFALTALILLLTLSLVDVREIRAQDTEDKSLPPVYLMFGNVGYSDVGLSAGAGFRYSFVGLSLGLAGFANSMPNFRKDYWIKESEIGGTERLTKMIFHVDANLYWDLSDIVSVFGMIGYYSQSDSILARKVWTATDSDDYLYQYKAETLSGLCFGLGGHYFFTSQLLIGLGWHSKSGFFAQVGYWWD
jgi:hypothetical protein